MERVHRPQHRGIEPFEFPAEKIGDIHDGNHVCVDYLHEERGADDHLEHSFLVLGRVFQSDLGLRVRGLDQLLLFGNIKHQEIHIQFLDDWRIDGQAEL